MITVNGEARQGFEGKTLEELLRALGYQTARVAVERNGAIVKKDGYGGAVVQEGDQIEVVSFVGGG